MRISGLFVGPLEYPHRTLDNNSASQIMNRFIATDMTTSDLVITYCLLTRLPRRHLLRNSSFLRNVVKLLPDSRRHIPEDDALHSQRRENLTFQRYALHSFSKWNLLLNNWLNNWLHGAQSFLRSRQFCSHSRTSHHIMEPKGSFSCSQESSTGPYPEPDQSSPYHFILSL
jgi:hypothetical protein